MNQKKELRTYVLLNGNPRANYYILDKDIMEDIILYKPCHGPSSRMPIAIDTMLYKVKMGGQWQTLPVDEFIPQEPMPIISVELWKLVCVPPKGYPKKSFKFKSFYN